MMNLNNKYIINPNFDRDFFKNILLINNFFGIEKILFDSNTGRGLLVSNYNDILTLEEILLDIELIYAKPPLIYQISNNFINGFNNYNNDNDIFIVNNYGMIRKNYENPNLNLFKFYDNYSVLDKIKLIHYYIRTNNWNIYYYNKADISNINDDTLKYALLTVGCIYSIEIIKNITTNKNNPPIYILHYNKDFKKKYNNIFDNCRIIENSLYPLLWWIRDITLLFNILSLKYNFNDIIYLNIFDHPIRTNNISPIRQKLTEHPFPLMNTQINHIKDNIDIIPNKPIYTFSGKQNYNDILIIFPDILMFYFSYELNLNFNINTYLNYYKILKDKINKLIFRGSLNYCSKKFEDSIRIIAHIKSLQNNYNIIDCKITNSNHRMIYSKNSYLKINNMINLDSDPKTPEEQLEYRYILYLDGFASAWRIIKELYYNSIIVIPDTLYTNIILNILKPWKHYIPVKKKLENLINTISWCNDHFELMEIILKNMIELRNKYITFDNLLILTSNNINNDSTTLQREIISYTNSQPEIEDPNIQNDDINILNKEAEFILSRDGIELSTETIIYNKYLKYKNKYLNNK